jgi:hypothetical protein
MSAAFGSAISHCIKCLFLPRTDWHADAFRNDMISEVLLPLMRELQSSIDYNPR